MTNQQLAILYMELHCKLEAALIEAEEALPPEAKKTFKTFLGKEKTFTPALSGIQTAVNELKQHADLLLNEGAKP